MKRILVTGGAGYIGTHTLVELSQAGYKSVVLDNLSNSCEKALERVMEITGDTYKFYKGDITDREIYKRIFSENEIEACIHFAGLKSPSESVKVPLLYFQNNIIGSIILFEELFKRNVKKLIFSSSASVYGEPDSVPITEEHPKHMASTPYAESKSMIEEMLIDISRADKSFSCAIMRYFNPIGAHESGLIGEDPRDIPNNLMPYITQVAVGRLPELRVFGDDYGTKDGTGVRDYIHITDLAGGHVKALQKLKKGVNIYNLGTGKGSSVLEMVKAFEESTGVNVPYKITDRRPGDIGECYCSAEKAERELGWKAEKGIKKMCEDAWNWQKNNPDGYR